jgi:PQQ-like domain
VREDGRVRLVPLALAGLAAALLAPGAQAVWPAPTPEAPRLPWASYGHDDQLTNRLDQSDLNPDNVAGLRLRWEQQLDRAVWASPLYADGRVYVATEGGSVYALDAVDGAVMWRRTFGTVDRGTPPDCGTFGITSTGAIDAARGALFVADAHGLLQALDLRDGSTLPGWPLQVVDRPDAEYVWGGLRILGDRLFVPIASYCDNGDDSGRLADGSLVSVDLGAVAVATRLDPVPGPDNLGGPWGYGGVSIERDGSFLYTAFGNAEAVDPVCDCISEGAGLGDSVARLTPDLEVVDFNRPGDVPTEGDFDFGAAPLVFRPDGCEPLAAANNKNGSTYVWRRFDLAAGPVSEVADGTVSGPFVGEPSWLPERRLLVVGGARILVDGREIGDGVQAFEVGADCRLHPAWQTRTGVGTQPPPLVVGDLVFAQGGIAGGLFALDGATGRVLWSFPADRTDASVAPLIAAGNDLYAADSAGVVRAFGF